LGVKESGERIGEAQMTLLIFMTVVTFLEDGAALLIILICTCLLIGQLIFPWRAFHSGIFLIVYLGGVLVLALYSVITTANPKLPPFRWVVFFVPFALLVRDSQQGRFSFGNELAGTPGLILLLLLLLLFVLVVLVDLLKP